MRKDRLENRNTRVILTAGLRRVGGFETSRQVSDDLQVCTFGAETSSDVWFGRGDVGQAQSAFIKVLIGEKVSEAHVGGFLCDVSAELLQVHIQRTHHVLYFLSVSQPEVCSLETSMRQTPWPPLYTDM